MSQLDRRRGPRSAPRAPHEAIHRQEDQNTTVTEATDISRSRAAERAWREELDAALAILAELGDPFGIDDVRELGVPEPRHPQRWGMVISAAARSGVIKLAGLSINSTGRPCRLWVGRPS
jgi:hypothetical protein